MENQGNIIKIARLCNYDPLQAISEYTWLEIQYSKEVLPYITETAQKKAYNELIDTMLNYYQTRKPKMKTHDCLVNLIDERLLNATDHKGNKLYDIVEREKIFYDKHTHNTLMEIDNYAIHFGKMNTYLLLFEDKSCPKHSAKAHFQLDREKEHAYRIFEKYHMPVPNNLKIHTFYVYNWKKPTIERIK